ncbi:MAG: type II toxin-antitoxin system VapC family toxin [Gemmatimonadota bacterium]
MILDTSAIVAIAVREPGHEDLLGKMLRAPAVGVGVPTLTETAIVLSARLGEDARGLLARFLLEGSIQTIAFGEAHFGVAVHAWLRYGRGRHPADLNFGDCLSYATAKVADRPLLCTGDDFAKTDLRLA